MITSKFIIITTLTLLLSAMGASGVSAQNLSRDTLLRTSIEKFISATGQQFIDFDSPDYNIEIKENKLSNMFDVKINERPFECVPGNMRSMVGADYSDLGYSEIKLDASFRSSICEDLIVDYQLASEVSEFLSSQSTLPVSPRLIAQPDNDVKKEILDRVEKSFPFNKPEYFLNFGLESNENEYRLLRTFRDSKEDFNKYELVIVGFPTPAGVEEPLLGFNGIPLVDCNSIFKTACVETKYERTIGRHGFKGADGTIVRCDTSPNTINDTCFMSAQGLFKVRNSIVTPEIFLAGNYENTFFASGVMIDKNGIFGLTADHVVTGNNFHPFAAVTHVVTGVKLDDGDELAYVSRDKHCRPLAMVRCSVFRPVPEDQEIDGKTNLDLVSYELSDTRAVDFAGFSHQVLRSNMATELLDVPDFIGIGYGNRQDPFNINQGTDAGTKRGGLLIVGGSCGIDCFTSPMINMVAKDTMNGGIVSRPCIIDSGSPIYVRLAGGGLAVIGIVSREAGAPGDSNCVHNINIVNLTHPDIQSHIVSAIAQRTGLSEAEIHDRVITPETKVPLTKQIYLANNQ